MPTLSLHHHNHPSHVELQPTGSFPSSSNSNHNFSPKSIRHTNTFSSSSLSSSAVSSISNSNRHIDNTYMLSSGHLYDEYDDKDDEYDSDDSSDAQEMGPHLISPSCEWGEGEDEEILGHSNIMGIYGIHDMVEEEGEEDEEETRDNEMGYAPSDHPLKMGNNTTTMYMGENKHDVYPSDKSSNISSSPNSSPTSNTRIRGIMRKTRAPIAAGEHNKNTRGRGLRIQTSNFDNLNNVNKEGSISSNIPQVSPQVRSRPREKVDFAKSTFERLRVKDQLNNTNNNWGQLLQRSSSLSHAVPEKENPQSYLISPTNTAPTSPEKRKKKQLSSSSSTSSTVPNSFLPHPPRSSHQSTTTSNTPLLERERSHRRVSSEGKIINQQYMATNRRIIYQVGGKPPRSPSMMQGNLNCFTSTNNASPQSQSHHRRSVSLSSVFSVPTNNSLMTPTSNIPRIRKSESRDTISSTSSSCLGGARSGGSPSISATIGGSSPKKKTYIRKKRTSPSRNQQQNYRPGSIESVCERGNDDFPVAAYYRKESGRRKYFGNSNTYTMPNYVDLTIVDSLSSTERLLTGMDDDASRMDPDPDDRHDDVNDSDNETKSSYSCEEEDQPFLLGGADDDELMDEYHHPDDNEPYAETILKEMRGRSPSSSSSDFSPSRSPMPFQKKRNDGVCDANATHYSSKGNDDVNAASINTPSADHGNKCVGPLCSSETSSQWSSSSSSVHNKKMDKEGESKVCRALPSPVVSNEIGDSAFPALKEDVGLGIDIFSNVRHGSCKDTAASAKTTISTAHASSSVSTSTTTMSRTNDDSGSKKINTGEINTSAPVSNDLPLLISDVKKENDKGERKNDKKMSPSKKQKSFSKRIKNSFFRKKSLLCSGSLNDVIEDRACEV